MRAPAQRAADDGAAVCFHSSGGFLGLGDRLGKLATGYRADMVALDGAAIAVLDTWVAGAGGERFPEIDPLLSPIRPREGGNQQIYCYVALSVWVLACA